MKIVLIEKGYYSKVVTIKSHDNIIKFVLIYNRLRSIYLKRLSLSLSRFVPLTHTVYIAADPTHMDVDRDVHARGPTTLPQRNTCILYAE